MIVDSSALVGILLREPGWKSLMEHVVDAERIGVGVPTLVEAGMVLMGRMGPAGKSLLVRFVTDTPMDAVAMTGEHWPVALDAFARYGKGRHPARLNYGDCLTYAVAWVAQEPLLCLGDDFARTDLDVVQLS